MFPSQVHTVLDTITLFPQRAVLSVRAATDNAELATSIDIDGLRHALPVSILTVHGFVHTVSVPADVCEAADPTVYEQNR